jgi:hypothetical protein
MLVDAVIFFVIVSAKKSILSCCRCVPFALLLYMSAIRPIWQFFVPDKHKMRV